MYYIGIDLGGCGCGGCWGGGGGGWRRGGGGARLGFQAGVWGRLRGGSPGL